MAGTTMAVAMGESVANMLQPFFALPLLAIAGVPMRRMLGFMVITFLRSPGLWRFAAISSTCFLRGTQKPVPGELIL
jgi:hypothetical protein